MRISASHLMPALCKYKFSAALNYIERRERQAKTDCQPESIEPVRRAWQWETTTLGGSSKWCAKEPTTTLFRLLHVSLSFSAAVGWLTERARRDTRKLYWGWFLFLHKPRAVNDAMKRWVVGECFYRSDVSLLLWRYASVSAIKASRFPSIYSFESNFYSTYTTYPAASRMAMSGERSVNRKRISWGNENRTQLPWFVLF